MTFLKGTETKYQMKTKRVLISKEQKQIQKRRRRRDAQNSTESFFSDSTANLKSLSLRTKLIKGEQFPVSPNGSDGRGHN